MHDSIPNIDHICEGFVNDHEIRLTGFIEQEAFAIYWTRRAQQEIDDGLRIHSQRLLDSGEESWGLLRTMLARVSENTEAAICAYVTGSPAAAEIIARTVVEGSLHIGYILQKDCYLRLSQYLSHYFAKEEREINQWFTLADKQQQDGLTDAANINRNAALKKQQALRSQESLIVQGFPSMGLQPLRQSGWPHRIFDQFQALGLENDYRTVYAAMCSQTHNDAEDLINHFIFKSLGDPELLEAVALETVYFSRLLLYFGVRFHVMAASDFARYYELVEAQNVLREGREQLLDIQSRIMSGIS